MHPSLSVEMQNQRKENLAPLLNHYSQWLSTVHLIATEVFRLLKTNSSLK